MCMSPWKVPLCMSPWKELPPRWLRRRVRVLCNWWALDCDMVILFRCLLMLFSFWHRQRVFQNDRADKRRKGQQTQGCHKAASALLYSWVVASEGCGTLHGSHPYILYIYYINPFFLICGAICALTFGTSWFHMGKHYLFESHSSTIVSTKNWWKMLKTFASEICSFVTR